MKEQINLKKATAALEAINPADLVPYAEYFKQITPNDATEIFQRFLFAFSSVHTTWKYNVNLFSLLFDLSWRGDQQKLFDRITERRAGLTEGRTKSIHKFDIDFWSDPEWYLKRDNELWSQYRDRVQARTLGLGHAKSSFAIALLYPNTAEVICGDTHQLQAFGLKGNSSPSQKMYSCIEQHWVLECRRLGLACVAARWCMWDRKQGKTNPRYWSYCLEGDNPEMVCPRQLELFTYKETLQ